MQINLDEILKKRDMEDILNFGVVVVDKPKGPTSHQVSAWTRKILNIPKAGHAGTLDPNVTGVLPVGLKKATKIINIIHREPKEYVVLMVLHKDVKKESLEKVINKNIGEISQLPPVRSAVKRRVRKRHIHSISLLETDNRRVLFKVRCEAGTYIRTLCKDVGKSLGVGAHMEELRRINTGPFFEKDAIILQDLLDGYVYWKENDDLSLLKKVIFPGEKIVENLPKIRIKDSAVDAIAHGADLYAAGVLEFDSEIIKGNIVAVITESQELVGIGNAHLDTEELAHVEKGAVVNMKKIMIERGKYPSYWKKSNR